MAWVQVFAGTLPRLIFFGCGTMSVFLSGAFSWCAVTHAYESKGIRRWYKRSGKVVTSGAKLAYSSTHVVEDTKWADDERTVRRKRKVNRVSSSRRRANAGIIFIP